MPLERQGRNWRRGTAWGVPGLSTSSWKSIAGSRRRRESGFECRTVAPAPTITDGCSIGSRASITTCSARSQGRTGNPWLVLQPDEWIRGGGALLLAGPSLSGSCLYRQRQDLDRGASGLDGRDCAACPGRAGRVALHRRRNWSAQGTLRSLRARAYQRTKGFKGVLPVWWGVERSFPLAAGLRRRAKDDERLPRTLLGLHFVTCVFLLLPKPGPSLTQVPDRVPPGEYYR